MPLNLDGDLRNADWTKSSFDLINFDSADQLRGWIEAQGMTVEQFKALPAYYLSLKSEKAPDWLLDL